jgi:hypothetical protein
MRHTSNGALALFFVLGMSVVATAPAWAADHCSALIPPGGLYDEIRSVNGSSFQQLIDEYVSTKEYFTHEDAVNDGFSVGAIVYGVPLQLGNTFTENQRSQWKKEFERRYHSQVNQQQYASFRNLRLNIEAFREVVHCITQTSSRPGLNVDLMQIDDYHFNLSVWYAPNGLMDLPPRFTDLVSFRQAA